MRIFSCIDCGQAVRTRRDWALPEGWERVEGDTLCDRCTPVRRQQLELSPAQVLALFSWVEHNKRFACGHD
ncbi:MAG TPA: hypothetical protein VNN62_02275 [Methylomirabilota bacterium]|jgi:hypothetical protein|nr:hypothetical protein [Methylomirabilota bacterium]